LISITCISKKSATWHLNILINAQVVQLHANHDYQGPPIKVKVNGHQKIPQYGEIVTKILSKVLQSTQNTCLKVFSSNLSI
jgi:hypothetical protein